MTSISTGIAIASEPERPATALETAFHESAKSLYRYFAVRTGDAHAADDLMQQLWLCVAAQNARLPVLRPEHWLRRCAHRLFLTHLRRNGRGAQAALPNPELAAQLARQLVSESLPDEMLDRREVADQLRLAITALPAREQDVIAAFYFRGESHAEIAGDLRCGARAVEALLYRARQALRRALRHLEI